jgi:hypothetical protein
MSSGVADYPSRQCLPVTGSLLVGLLALLLSACAPAPFERAHLDEATSACVSLLEGFDGTVDAAGLASADLRRVPGFPALRSDRFHASFRDELYNARLGGPRLEAWFDHLLSLGRQARLVESARLARLASPPAHPSLEALDACAEQVTAHDRRHPGAVRRLLDNVQPTDDYRWASRIAGLYLPAGAWLLSWGAGNESERLLADFQAAAGTDAAAGLEVIARLSPPPAAARASGAVLTAGIALLPTPREESLDPTMPRWPVPVQHSPHPGPHFPLARDILDIPRPDATTVATLAYRHAPSIRIVAAAGTAPAAQANLPGAVVATTGEPRFAVEPLQPTIYVRPAWTRFGGRSLLQLEYTAWFSERPPSGRFDALAGAFDGFVWRVTLDEDGTVLMADSIHACGCWHLAFPGPRLAPRTVRLGPADPLTRPVGLPPGEGTLELTLTADTHQLIGLQRFPAATSGEASASVTYALAPARDLATAMSVDGLPFYGRFGLIAGSERSERWWLWPSGVRAAGSQRQWGNQATAFVGERHFDDPYFIENHFVPRLGAADL